MIEFRNPTFSGKLQIALALGATVVLSAALWGQAVNVNLNAPAEGAGEEPNEPASVPIVNADEELAGFLRQAGELIGNGEYSRAIEILHALIQRPDAGFIATGDPRRFVSLRSRANEMIAKMPEPGVALYRNLHNAQAGRLYRRAVDTGDQGGLRRVAEQYLNTCWGPEAMGRLAEAAFDEGRFAAAARAWRRLVDIAAPADRPMLLARSAVASHLAGDRQTAEALAGRLKQDHPDARTRLAGRERSVHAFVAEMLSREPPAVGEPGGWPGFGGVADGAGMMSDCDVALTPRWRVPSVDGTGGELLEGLEAELTYNPAGQGVRVVRGGPVVIGGFNRSGSGGGSGATSVRLRYGRLELRSAQGNQLYQAVLPPLIHPAVTGDLVIYRNGQRVVACDLFTGRIAWKTDELPVTRQAPSAGGRYYSPVAMPLGDLSRYAVTTDSRRAYFVCDFLPATPGRHPGRFGRPQNQDAGKVANDSAVAAVDVDDGKIAWKIGRGSGDTDLLRGCVYLGAPTPHRGRLYVTTEYRESYHLVCLDARTGRSVWSVPICQSPVLGGRYQIHYGTLLGAGSSLAVADGRVYVTSNTGVLACFDADTGQAVWAYQYPSPLSDLAGSGNGYYGLRSVMERPANPVIARDGRIVCLPSDSEDVLCLAAADGEMLWKVDRMDQDHLAAAPGGRIVLAGEGLAVLSDAGEELFSRYGTDIVGRPAVTPTSVLASGKGQLWRLSLEDYSISADALADAAGLLGNTVAVDGKLITANAAGVCGYFDFQSVYDQLARRMEAADPPRRTGLQFQRAQVSFKARRYEEAIADFLTCRDRAAAADDTGMLARLDHLIYRTYVALGNTAESTERMGRMFRLAAERAPTELSRAQMTLRLAKYQEQTGRYDQAASLGQELLSEYGEMELVDVRIGHDAESDVRYDERTPTVLGRKLAGNFLRRLIAVHGRGCYAAFDAEAKQAFDAARGADEPVEAMLEVARRWPVSRWADNARFAAAEIYYRRAVATDADAAGPEMARATRQLHAVANDPDSELRTSARVALSVINARSAPELVDLSLDPLRDLPGDTEIAFAEIRGTLGEVIRRIESGNVSAVAGEPAEITRLSPPLAEAFAIEGRDVQLLCDQDFRPVRLDQAVLVRSDDKAILIDTASGDADSAVLWEAMARLDVEALRRRGMRVPGTSLIAGLTGDREHIVVSDMQTLTGLDSGTGRVVWQKSISELDVVNPLFQSVGRGGLVLVGLQGDLTCVEIADGSVRWRAKVTGADRKVLGPPQIAGRVVLVRSDSARRLTAFDADGGRVLGEWTGNSACHGRLTGKGLLVMMQDHQLVACRVAAPQHKVLWKHSLTTGAAILAADGDRVAVSPSTRSDKVAVLSLSGGGRKLAEFSVNGAGGEKWAPVDARFAGDALYVAATHSPASEARTSYWQPFQGRGFAVEKFSLADGGGHWRRAILTAPQGPRLAMLPIIPAGPSVVVPLLCQDGARAGTYVLDDADGRIVRKIDWTSRPDQFDAMIQRRQGPIYSGATDGRLVQETFRGVVVYEGQ